MSQYRRDKVVAENTGRAGQLSNCLPSPILSQSGCATEQLSNQALTKYFLRTGPSDQ